MKEMAFFLGQITIILSLVLIQSTRPSTTQNTLRTMLSRITLSALSALFCLIATTHLRIGIGHKLLLKHFGVTFSPQVWQHFDRATFELAAQSWPATSTATTLGILLLPFLYWHLTLRLAQALRSTSFKKLVPLTWH